MSVGRPNIVDGGGMSRGKNQAMDGSRTTGVAAAEDPRRWRMLAIVATGVLLAMAPWFSSSAVAPLLTAEWGLDRLALSSYLRAQKAEVTIVSNAADFVQGLRGRRFDIGVTERLLAGQLAAQAGELGPH